MPSGAADFNGSLGSVLTAHVFEVDEELLGVFEKAFTLDSERGSVGILVLEIDDVEGRSDWVDIHASDHGGFAGVDVGYDEPADLAAPGFDGNRQGAADAADAAVE